nr:xylulose kinase-1 [Tanacetum cinerariifolium]
IGKGFSRVETLLFATMLVQPQAAVEEEDEEDEVPAAPTPPSPTHKPSPPPHEPITSSLQAQPAPPSSPPQEQPTDTSQSSVTILHTLMETYATLSQKVSHLEQDKIAQALEIIKLNQRVKRLEKKRRSNHSGIKRLRKSDTSAGFDQIVDFLNAQVIHYALIVNPTIYVSFIKQFWATALIKKVNDVFKLQALIDRKKVVITEDIIRQDLRLDDANGVEYFPNEEIFAELARMGYEKPPPKLTFYKVFFSAQ